MTKPSPMGDPSVQAFLEHGRKAIAAKLEAEAAERREKLISRALSYEDWCAIEAAVQMRQLKLPSLEKLLPGIHREWSMRNVHFGDLRED